MPDSRHARPMSPLQRKLHDKALAMVSEERSRMLEPLHAVLRRRESSYTHTADATAEDAVGRTIETMLPDWGGLIVAETALPEDAAGIVDALMRVAQPHGPDKDSVLWFEASLHSQSSLVSFEDCRYGVFSGMLGDLVQVVGLIKGMSASPIGWSRLALVSADHRWMIWVEASRATHCAPAEKA